MEYFILMFVMGSILIFLKVISVGHTFFQAGLLVIWVFFVWKLYPNLLSRSDKWRSGAALLFINRVIVAIVAGYVFFVVVYGK